jgi:hypothetical protein
MQRCIGLGMAMHLPPITNHQSPITNHQSPITNHQSPITNHQSPIKQRHADCRADLGQGPGHTLQNVHPTNHQSPKSPAPISMQPWQRTATSRELFCTEICSLNSQNVFKVRHPPQTIHSPRAMHFLCTVKVAQSEGHNTIESTFMSDA